MDPLEIEDTSDWLGTPTELETFKHYLAMVENEVQELTLQLRKAREDIFGLVQMHSAAADERDHVRAKVRVISELYARVAELTGIEPYTKLPGN